MSLFAQLYPEPASELNFKNDFQLIISVVLSAQCTDKKVNEVTPQLFSEFSSFKTLKNASISKVERIIRQVNYYKTKAKNIVGLAKMIEENFEGKIPTTFDEITQLPGVGRKTASVVLGELGITHTLPVDTHVFRVSKRLGLATGLNVKEVEAELRRAFSPDQWRPLHHYLIFHGRRVCKAQRPLCLSCTLSPLCPSSP